MRKILLTFFVVIGIVGLFLEQYRNIPGVQQWLILVIDYSLVSYLLADFIWGIYSSGNITLYIKRNLFSFIFLILYLSLFIFNQIMNQNVDILNQDNNLMTVLRSLLLVLKIFGRFKKMSSYVQSIITKPAQTVVFSFILLILIGALILMMPIMSTSSALRPLNALFTVTSAVCVTGLIVVDTASQFTYAGKTVLILLIQAGGLGIMLLSFFMVFLFKQNLSIKDRNLLSYMLNSQNSKNLKQNVLRIISLTFLIELGGALLLFPVFIRNGLKVGEAVFFSFFHSISAFCNAGFALYSDSLISLNGDYLANFVISALIITGGISFVVLTDLYSVIKSRLHKNKSFLSINSKIVLIVSSFLLLGGTLLIYKLEHATNLYPMAVSQQYLSAFFQSVTLRTAGFNTIPLDNLNNGTLILMMGIMFIGGASGSTAGGIKVNTLGIVWAYIRSFRRGHEEILIYRHQVSKDSVLQAFTVIVFAVFSIFLISSILFITEKAEPIKIVFETVSAFATVGLSTGITGDLTNTGKLGIIFLMFLGRLGPLTLLTASSGKEKQSRVSYPEASSIMIG